MDVIGGLNDRTRGIPIKKEPKVFDPSMNGGINLGGIQNLATVDIPVIKEDKTNDWVRWGSSNNFPQTLIDALNSSPTHNSIILTKKNMVSGKKILIEPQQKGLYGRLFGSKTHKKTQDFINNCNQYGENLHDVVGKIAYDYLAFNQGFFQPIFLKGGGLQIEHIQGDRIRCGIEDMGSVKNYWYSKLWKEYRKNENKPVNLQKFDYENVKSQSIVPLSSYRPGGTYYPLPEYYSAINYIELDGKISRFHLSNIDNGLVPSLLMQFNQGTPTDEQREALYKRIEDTLTGSYNTGKFLLLFNDSKETEATIDVIENNNIDKQYILLNEMVLQNILTASRVSSPLLMGIKTPGQLGVIEELKSSYQMFYNNTILPVQNLIMNEINRVGELAGLKPMFIESPAPLEFLFSESVLGKIMMIDELRNEIGLDPLEDGSGGVLIDYKKETDNVEEPVPVETDTEKNNKK